MPIAPRKKQTPTLTPLELEIMKVLWELGSGTVQAVLDAMPGEPLAYTTVQTMLNVLQTKGKAKRVLKDRAFVYRPAVTRKQAVSSTMRDLIDRMFGGSAEALVMGLLETGQISAEKLAELQAKVEKR
ncbi:MAG TPA: BlaI/MecI/CopY family transcriptional regulator [Bryobacteraceae bacterium]|jgi:predicted transcriptional regulator